MNFKKIIAALLATAMVMTSSSFTEVAFAADITEDAALVQNDAVSSDSASADEQAPVVDDQQEQAAAEPVVEEAGAEPAAEEEPAIDDNAEPAGEGAEPAGDAAAADNAEPAGDSDTLEGAGEDGDELMEANDYFEVDGGVLKLKDDVSLSDLQQDVKIPANTVTIPDNIFKDNQNVKTVTFERSYVDGDEVKNEQLLTTIADEAFAGSAITDIIGLPSTLTVIPDRCFKGSQLKRISFETNSSDTTKSSIEEFVSETITEIGAGAFENVEFDGLSPTLTFKGDPENRNTTVGDSAFKDSNIARIYWNGNIQYVGANAFEGCENLISFENDINYWPDSLLYIGDNAFKGTDFKYIDLTLVPLEEKGTDPNTYYSIGKNAFQNCKHLETFTFPKVTTIVEEYTFAGCTDLKTVLFPETDVDDGEITGITGIRHHAFSGCSSLAVIDLQEAYQVDAYAFDSCPKLKTITFGYKRDEVKTEGVPDPEKINVEDSAFFHNLSTTEKKNYKLYGYDDDYLSQYADDHLYTYYTRNIRFNIEKSDKDMSKFVTLTAPKQALPGEKVTVTVKPQGDRCIDSFRVYKKGGGTVEHTLVSSNAESVTFSFLMPKGDAIVEPSTIDVSAISVSPSLLFHTLNDIEKGTIVKNYTDGIYSFAETGESYKLNITLKGSPLPNWMWKFESAKPAIVSVTSDGIVSSIGAGRTELTVSLLKDSSRKFKINVEVLDVFPICATFVKGRNYPDAEHPAFTKWETGIVPPVGKVKEIPTIETRKVNISGVEYEYPVVKVRRSSITNGSLSFEVNVDAYAVQKFNADDMPIQLVSGADVEPEDISYDEAKSVIANTRWSSSDTTIATVAKSSSTTNNNTVTIKQNSYGEAAISISVLNDGEKKVNEKKWERNETFVIVEVWDDTPRIAEKEITINAQKEANWVTLINAYGGDVYDDSGFGLYTNIRCTDASKVKNLKVQTYQFTRKDHWDPADPPSIDQATEYNYDTHDQMINIVTTDAYDQNTPLNKTNTYKGLYLKCQVKGVSKPFVIAMPTIKVINTQPNPTIKTYNKFNLFYKAAADPGNGYPDHVPMNDPVTTTTGVSQVYFTQSVTSETVRADRGMTFISKENHATYGKTRNGLGALEKVLDDKVTDKFHENFTVGAGATDSKKNNYFPITRNSIASQRWDINCDKSDNAITSGFLYIWYEGYKYPVQKSYTVPTEVKAPSYALNQTTQTANAKARGVEYRIWLYDTTIKGAKAAGRKVDLSVIDDGEEGLSIDKNKTKNTSVNKDWEVVQRHVDYDDITIQIKNRPEAGLVVIRLHMTTWSDYKKTKDTKDLRYNYTIKTTSSIPTAKFDKTTAKFNIAYENEHPAIKATMSQPTEVDDLTQPIFGFTKVTYKGSKKYATEIRENDAITIHSGDTELILDPNDENWAEIVESPAGDLNGVLTFDLGEIADPITGIDKPMLPKGNYSFSIVPAVKLYGTADPIELKPITFTVSLTEAKPKLVLKSSTFPINYSDYIISSANAWSKTTFTITNLSANTSYSDYVLTEGEDFAWKPSSDKVPLLSTITEDPEFPFSPGIDPLTLADCSMKLTRKDGVTKDKGFSYKYYIHDLVMEAADDGPQPREPLADVAFTVSGFVRKPALSVKATGSINFVDTFLAPVVTTSRVMYTATLKDVQDEIRHISLTEHIEGNDYNSDDEEPDDPKMYFGIITKETDGYGDILKANECYVYIKEPNGYGANPGDGSENFRLKPGTSYNISLNYTVDGFDGEEYEYKTTIKPTQTLPKLTVSQRRNYIYAGEDDTYDPTDPEAIAKYQNRRLYAYVTTPLIGKTVFRNAITSVGREMREIDDKGYYTGTESAYGITWDPSTPESYKKAFDIEKVTYMEASDKYMFSIRLKNAAILKQNTEYTLKFVTHFDGQAIKTNGAPISLKVTIKK